MNARDPEDANAERLLKLLGGKWIAASVSAAASLGIAEALADGPKSVESLAADVGCDAGALLRLLRVLVGEGVVELTDERTYAITPLGALLRRGEFGELAEFVGAPFSWDPWSKLPEAVRTGDAAFALHHGQGLFPYLDANADEARLYHAAIDGFTRRQARALAELFDFSKVSRVADIGGGRGTLLVEVLRRWTHLEGVLLERGGAVTLAQKAFVEAGLSARCVAREGDFFEAVPAGVDVCVVKHVVHNWDDARASQLLRGCAKAVGPEGHVLVVEGLLLPGNRKDATALLDIEMLALCGPGRERTKPEMRRLFTASGLRLVSTHDLAGMTRLLICRPIPD